jgi:hypothetical protein
LLTPRVFGTASRLRPRVPAAAAGSHAAVPACLMRDAAEYGPNYMAALKNLGEVNVARAGDPIKASAVHARTHAHAQAGRSLRLRSGTPWCTPLRTRSLRGTTSSVPGARARAQDDDGLTHACRGPLRSAGLDAKALLLMRSLLPEWAYCVFSNLVRVARVSPVCAVISAIVGMSARASAPQVFPMPKMAKAAAARQ